MSSFTEKLTVTELAEMVWMVDRPFRYYVGYEDSNDFIDVPEGTITDFASVPKFLWPWFPPIGTYTQAAVLHDYLYQTHLRSRDNSDKIFLEAMEVLGTPYLQRKTMYTCVRWFGGGVWKTYGSLKLKMFKEGLA